MGIDDNTRGWIESFLADWMERADCPGLCVALLDGDQRYATGIGSRDLASNDPVTPDTLYGIASCTKSFTAAAVMQLAERGDLDVHDPVSDHLPVDVWADADPPISIHDLLTHSSGLPGDGSAFRLLTRELGLTNATTPLATVEDFVRFTDGSLDERVAGPGEVFHYHNTGYTLLGAVVAHRSGVPFDRYVREKLLDPLDMPRSTFHRADVEADDDALTPHLVGEDGPKPASFPFDDQIYAPGGLLSSVAELSNYLRMYLAGGEYEGERILAEESVEAMLDGYLQWDYGLSGSDNEYGYGWTTKEFMGERVCSHVGDIVVSSAYVGFLPERDLGIAILANISPPYLMQAVGEGVLAIFLGGDPARDVPFWGVREKFDRLTGWYESYGGVLSGTVAPDGNVLRFEADGAPAVSFLVVPETTDPDDYSFYTFAEEGYPKPLRVEADGDDVEITLGRWRLHRVADL